MALAHQFGLTTHAVVQALDNGPLASPFVSGKLQRIAVGDYSPEFSLALALKDVDLALDAADPAGLPVTDQLATVWHHAVEQGRGDADVTVVARTLDGSPR